MKKMLILLAVFISTNSFAQKSKWTALFDGKTTTGWHSWKSNEVKGWHVMMGELMTHGGNGDLVTDKEYADFILEFEFKVSPKGNSGLIYKVLEDPTNQAFFATYASGPEFQIIDDENYPAVLTNKQKTGANYDIYPPLTYTAVKPAGQWNKGKVKIQNNRIEHWLNGKKVADYEYGSIKWKDDVAGSKFSKMPYNQPHAKGKIALQDHNDAVSFRKIRIKEL
jgi:Domain of Unknown Function (DUF1080)